MDKRRYNSAQKFLKVLGVYDYKIKTGNVKGMRLSDVLMAYRSYLKLANQKEISVIPKIKPRRNLKLIEIVNC